MKSNRVIKVFSKNKILKKEFIRENKFSRKTEFLRKSVVFIVTISMILGMAGCGKTTEKEDNYRLKIVTSLFPYYDMARAVIGDVKGIDLKMTVTPGQDSHSFEPTPSDVIQMENADVLIYNGGSLETWIDTLLDYLNNKNQIQMKMMDYVDVLNEEIVEGMDTRFEEHDHDEHSHKEDNYNKENHKEDSHSEDSSNDSEFHNEDSEEGHEETDEHIWTSPVNEIIMTEKICETLSKALPEEKENFQKNAESYISQLKELDNEFRTIVENAKINEIIFADKFPLQYFAKEYGLKYYAAFPGCGSDMEPSAKTIGFLVDKIKEDNIKAVFYLELSSHIVADAIFRKGIELLVWTCKLQMLYDAVFCTDDKFFRFAFFRKIHNTGGTSYIISCFRYFRQTFRMN